jgi:arylformamidase
MYHYLPISFHFYFLICNYTMEIELKLESGSYNINTDEPIDISIPLIFGSKQPNSYNADKASSKACETGDFIGDTRRGGSCNFEEVKLIPHCNGTHTECVGHISDERISVYDTLKDVFIPATLITVKPSRSSDTTDSYNPPKDEKDLLITRKSIEDSLGKFNKDFLNGLIIRTLPNDDSKKSKRYMDSPPPFFSIEAMEYISELGIQHLLVDIPSVDRTFDEGKLSVHHIYWKVKQGSHKVDKNNHSPNTITEMVYITNKIEDGLYLLNLQIAPFVSDAAPSRPVIFRIMN